MLPLRSVAEKPMMRVPSRSVRAQPERDFYTNKCAGSTKSPSNPSLESPFLAKTPDDPRSGLRAGHARPVDLLWRTSAEDPQSHPNRISPALRPQSSSHLQNQSLAFNKSLLQLGEFTRCTPMHLQRGDRVAREGQGCQARQPAELSEDVLVAEPVVADV